MEVRTWRSGLGFISRATPIRHYDVISRRYWGQQRGVQTTSTIRANMRVEVTLVGAPTADSAGTTIFVNAERAAYVFGHVPEGYQRFIKSRGVTWTKLNQTYFLSGGSEWGSMSGLPGTLLSLAGAGASKLESLAQENADRQKRGLKPQTTKAETYDVPIHGADNLSHMFASLRPMLLRQPIKVNLHDYKGDPTSTTTPGRACDYADDQLRVWKVPVQKPRSGSPWKRRCASPSSDDAETHGDAANEASKEDSRRSWPILKQRPGPSDPYTAKWIVENGMLNGEKDVEMLLIAKPTRDLHPGEEAFKIINDQLTPYKLPDSSSDTSLSGHVYVRTQGWKPGVIDLKSRHLPRTTHGEVCMSYLIKSADHRGKFNPVAAKAKGVVPKDFGRLTRGETLVTESGETVTPDMVLGAPIPGNGIMIADIPTIDLIEPFFERPEWTDPVLMEHVVAVYWILGRGLYDNARIVEYMRSQPLMRHIVCAPETTPNSVTLPQSAEFTTQLRMLDPDRFPIIDFNNDAETKLPAFHPGEAGRVGDRYNLMPVVKPGTVENLRTEDLLGATKLIPTESTALAEEAQRQVEDPEFLARIEEEEKDIPNRDAEIIALGTGSASPTSIRGLCGTLVRVPGIGNYLLDCGEGVLNQMRRGFGEKETGEFLAELKCIVVSHMHGDHLLGVVNMIKAWYEKMLADGNNSSKLAISCSSRIMQVIEEISQAEDFGFHRLHFPNCFTTGKKPKDIMEADRAGLEDGEFGLVSIKRIPVTHCHGSCGTQLELTSGLRIAWSGDCRPSEAFADACVGTHLLVHEATFGNDEAKHAKEKNHCTLGEALGVAHRMKARRTLLTHFSARYVSALQGLEAEKGAVLPAWDLMRVKLGDWQKATAFLPAIEKLRAAQDDQPASTAA